MKTKRMYGAAAALSRDYCLDLLAVFHGRAHIIDTWLLLAVGQANHEPVLRTPADWQRFGAWDTPVPQALRWPVAIARIADTLDIPYETARRRSHSLCRAGYLADVDGGLIVPPEVAISNLMKAVTGRVHERTRRLFLQSAEIGLLDDLESIATLPAAPQPLVRASYGAGVTYLLRMAQAFQSVPGDLVDLIILLTLMRMNVERIGKGAVREVQDGAGPWAWIGDQERRPVVQAELAERTGVNRETLRRRLARLVDGGWVVRANGEYVVPSATFGRPELEGVTETVVSELRRMFRILGQIGVTAAWAREALQPGSLATSH